MGIGSLSADRIQRYQRQILLAPIGGAGQIKFASATILLHGTAPLCATYLAAAGLGCLRVTGQPPELSSHDPDFRLAHGKPGDPASLTLDLGDGAAWRAAKGARLWGGVVAGELRLGVEPEPGACGSAVLETLAAGEALWRLLGGEEHRYRF